MKIITILLVGSILFLQTAVSQTSHHKGVSEADRESIIGRVTALVGYECELHDIALVDSVLRYIDFDGGFEDPYGTLKRCYVFTYSRKDPPSNFSVGIFRDDRIIGRLDTVIKAEFSSSGQISTIADLNRDGSVDLVVTNSFPDQGTWIISWNGSNLSLINDVDTEGESVLDKSGLLFSDVNGDGIYELETVVEDETGKSEKVIYSWNGQKYGLWPTTPHALPGGYYPQDRFDAILHGTIRQDKNGAFFYRYSIQNKPESIQRIDVFWLASPDSLPATMLSPNEWHTGGNIGNYFGWDAQPGSRAYIRQGMSDSSFGFITDHLPSICTAYLRGNNMSIGETNDNLDLEFNSLYQDLITNSKSIKTVAPDYRLKGLAPEAFLDTLISYTSQSHPLGWIKEQSTVDRYLNSFAAIKAQLQRNDTQSAHQRLNEIIAQTIADSSSNITSEAYALLRFNTEYLLAHLPAATTPRPIIAIKNSRNEMIPGGSLQYYEGAWKNASSISDRLFTIDTKLKTVSLRMTYAYGSQQLNSITLGADTIFFNTIPVQVKLVNSGGIPIDTGFVQYYAGAWREFGSTSGGVATKELLPGSYPFRMTYAFASKDMTQDVNTNPVVSFSTIPVRVELRNSQNALMDQGAVQYYAGAWREFGSTSGGVAIKELLANNTPFRMTYAYVSVDKTQDLITNPSVVFATTRCSVRVKNAQNALVDNATISYYAGAWRILGTTVGGEVTKELLPASLQFRAKSGAMQQDKTQNIGVDPVVDIIMNLP